MGITIDPQTGMPNFSADLTHPPGTLQTPWRSAFKIAATGVGVTTNSAALTAESAKSLRAPSSGRAQNPVEVLASGIAIIPVSGGSILKLRPFAVAGDALAFGMKVREWRAVQGMNLYIPQLLCEVALTTCGKTDTWTPAPSPPTAAQPAAVTIRWVDTITVTNDMTPSPAEVLELKADAADDTPGAIAFDYGGANFIELEMSTLGTAGVTSVGCLWCEY